MTLFHFDWKRKGEQKMSKFKTVMKKNFPNLYDYYQHIQRKKIIHKIERIKSISSEQYPQILSDVYMSKLGSPLNWENLKTYTEKMQWAKLYDRDPKKTLLADKYKVRTWVADQIGEEYLIPLLGCWNSFNEIDFISLPKQFVLKTNHGTGTNMIVKDKATINYRSAKRKFDDWMAMDFGYVNNFQLHYSFIERKIIAEKYLETEQGELQDYKFLCFNGEPKFCWVDLGRYSVHTRTVFDMNWNLQPWTQENYEKYQGAIPKPKNFEKMVELATTLSKGFHHVRVDFYNVSGTIYFGEMTFTNASGFEPIVPKEYDLMLGNLWKLPTNV